MIAEKRNYSFSFLLLIVHAGGKEERVLAPHLTPHLRRPA